MGHCYLRFYSVESSSGVEHLLKISGIYHILHTSFQANKTGKNCTKMVFLVIFLVLPFLIPKIK